MKYPVVINQDPDDDSTYYAIVPDLKGCIGDGETPEAALLDAIRAADEWVLRARQLGRDIPEPGHAGRAYVGAFKTFHAKLTDLRQAVEQIAKDLKSPRNQRTSERPPIKRRAIIRLEERFVAVSEAIEVLGDPRSIESNELESENASRSSNYTH